MEILTLELFTLISLLLMIGLLFREARNNTKIIEDFDKEFYQDYEEMKGFFEPENETHLRLIKGGRDNNEP